MHWYQKKAKSPRKILALVSFRLVKPFLHTKHSKLNFAKKNPIFWRKWERVSPVTKSNPYLSQKGTFTEKFKESHWCRKLSEIFRALKFVKIHPVVFEISSDYNLILIPPRTSLHEKMVVLSRFNVRCLAKRPRTIHTVNQRWYKIILTTRP